MDILLVDDSRASRMIVRRALRQAGYGHFSVGEASNGAEALKVIEESKPDVVVCDWNMPEMSGIELLERLRAKGNETKLGFVTSEGTNDVRRRALVAGALFFVTKPITADRLQEALAPILE